MIEIVNSLYKILALHEICYNFLGMWIPLSGLEVILTKNYDGEHLTTTQRIKIEKGLMDGRSFVCIAGDIVKHPSKVAKEIRSTFF